MTLDRSAARSIADAYLDAYHRWDPTAPEVVIVDSSTREADAHWAFVYQSRRYIESGDFRHALAGNAPIFVAERDGAVSIGGSAETVEKQLEQPNPGRPVTDPPPDPALGAKITELQRAVAGYAKGSASSDIQRR
jgi:hypothetical protein